MVEQWLCTEACQDFDVTDVTLWNEANVRPQFRNTFFSQALEKLWISGRHTPSSPSAQGQLVMTVWTQD